MFLLTLILLYKYRIYDSGLIWENTDQWKLEYLNILFKIIEKDIGITYL